MSTIRFLTVIAACTAALSIGGCFKPPRSMPDASVIGYDGHGAVPPDCASLARPSLLRDAGVRRPSMEWGCANYTNLAAQLARPEDVVSPEKLGPTDAAVAASAVRRYETGHVTPFATGTSSSSGSH